MLEFFKLVATVLTVYGIETGSFVRLVPLGS